MTTLLVAVGLVTVLPACAAMAFGWLPPWLSGHITHPRLWGVGMFGIGFFAVTQIPALREHFEHAGTAGVALRLGVLGIGLAALLWSSDRLVRR
ncbi:hypothetical protein [Streptomyces sp. NBC_00009]|uniref:hypothetical protein n=1 Tax=Streptomyces sp. NBC_00009 TaxID=2975620 RepID=UPI00324DB572